MKALFFGVFFLLTTLLCGQDFFDSFDPWADTSFIRSQRIQRITMVPDSGAFALTAFIKVEITYDNLGRPIEKKEELQNFGSRVIFYSYSPGQKTKTIRRNNSTSRVISYDILKQGSLVEVLTEKDNVLQAVTYFAVDNDTLREITKSASGKKILEVKRVYNNEQKIFEQEVMPSGGYNRFYSNNKCEKETFVSENSTVEKTITWSGKLPDSIMVRENGVVIQIIKYDYSKSHDYFVKRFINSNGKESLIRFEIAYF